MKLEHPVVLSFIILLIDLIPYVGVGFIYIPWILYEFLSSNYQFVIQLTLLYICIVIVRQIIEPRLLAKSLGIHPLITLIVLFISFNYLGAIGFIITPIVLIITSSLYHAKIIHYPIRFIKTGYI